MNKKILIVALCAFFYQLTISPVFAVKATPFPILITQPDGSQLTIRLHGSEFSHFQTTTDGYILKENSKGFLTYAIVNSAGELVESSVIAQNPSKRTASEVQFLKVIDQTAVQQAVQNSAKKSKMLLTGANQPRKAYPLNGSPKALVILANFSDNAFSVSSPQTSFQNLVTQPGYSANGGTGSARDYFMASTYGKFAPNFIVVGPVTLPKTLSYYGTNSGGTAGNDVYPAQMIVDACAAADAAGLDFTQFDTDNDGYVDNVFVYYAGYNEAEGGAANTIWPHRWSISDAGITTGITFDGKKIKDYSCTSELKGNTGTNMCGVGTFCHEFGHVLGLPDYYDTSGTQSNTVATWEIMDYGPYLNGGNTPPSYSAWDRFFLGYLTPQQLSTPIDVTLQPLYLGTTTVANTDGQAYLIAASSSNMNGASPSPAEFFLVEYRKHSGWDTYLGQDVNSIGTTNGIPSDGMCIWHIDYLQSEWDANTPNNYTGTTQTASSHMRVYLQPLSGQTTTPGTTFTTGSFTPTTWTGTNINRPITAITKTTNYMTFKFMGGTPVPAISTSGSISGFSAVVGTPSTIQSVTVTGASLSSNIDITLNNQTNFDIKLASSSAWVKNLSIAPTSGSVNETLQIRYNPATVGNHSDNINLSSTSVTSTVNLSLIGNSTVPVVTNTPTIIIGKIDNSIEFPTVKVAKSSTKTINIKTTDISSFVTVAVSGTNASMFTVSTGTLTKDALNATSGTNITIVYFPTAVGNHSATLTISGGGLNPAKVINLTGSGN
jgi:M6 family metalloprotease-like protein